MPFPTTPILDTFIRANETPLSGGGNWVSSGGNALNLTSNAVVVAVSGQSGGRVWAASTYAGDYELYVTATVSDTTPTFAYVDLIWIVGANGYCVNMNRFGGTDRVEIQRIDSGVFGAIADSPDNVPTWTDGDSLGYRRIGNNHEVWFKPASGTWTRYLNHSDGTYTGTGNFFLLIKGDATKLNNFGGGPYVARAYPDVIYGAMRRQ